MFCLLMVRFGSFWVWGIKTWLNGAVEVTLWCWWWCWLVDPCCAVGLVWLVRTVVLLQDSDFTSFAHQIATQHSSKMFVPLLIWASFSVTAMFAVFFMIFRDISFWIYLLNHIAACSMFFIVYSSPCPWEGFQFLSFSSCSRSAHIHTQPTSVSLSSHTLTHIHTARALLTHTPLRGGWASHMRYSGYCGDGWAAALGVHPVSRAIHMEAKNRGQVNGSRCLILCTLIMTWRMQGQPQLHPIIYTLCEDQMSCRVSIMSYLALFVKSTPDSLQSFHFIYCRHLCFMKALLL